MLNLVTKFNKRNLLFVRQHFILFIIFIFLFGDLARVLANIFDSQFIQYPRYSKIIGLVFVGFYIVFFEFHKKAHSKPLILILIILTVVFVLNNSFLLDTNYFKNIIENSNYFAKALMLPFLLIPFFYINKEVTIKAVNVLKFLFWINTVFILFGFLFEF